MKRNWMATLGLALAIGLLAVASAAAEDPPANSEGVAPVAPETEPAPPASEAPSASEDLPFEITPLDENCFANEVCVWFNTNYGGTRETVPCDGAFHWFPNGRNSAKNRCGSRRSWLINSDGAGGVIYLVCMNPGGERPSPGLFSGVKIGPLGENCP